MTHLNNHLKWIIKLQCECKLCRIFVFHHTQLNPQPLSHPQYLYQKRFWQQSVAEFLQFLHFVVDSVVAYVNQNPKKMKKISLNKDFDQEASKTSRTLWRLCWASLLNGRQKVLRGLFKLNQNHSIFNFKAVKSKSSDFIFSIAKFPHLKLISTLNLTLLQRVDFPWKY